jgi:type 1 glutamine amidotransferase
MPNVVREHARFGGDAENLLTSPASSRYDALFYDMNQQRGAHSQALKQIMAQGKPVVFLHHAMGSYPEQTDYTQLLGGHVNFGGNITPDIPSTKFFHDVRMHVEIVNPRHPLTVGLHDFDGYDEAYKNGGIVPGVHVLLPTGYTDSDRAIVWTHRHKKLQVVYLQHGHGPQAFSHSIFEMLVHRSPLWSAAMKIVATNRNNSG